MFTVAALYRFARFADPAGMRGALKDCALAAGVRGTLLLAPEGINGTIAGSRAGVDAVLAHIRGLPGCAGLEAKEADAATMPFVRLKVKLKREIVTMGQLGIDPLAATGRRVDPADWNALIAAPDVAVIDVRNGYEVAIGSFRGAVNPTTERFRDFPGWWAANQRRFAGKRVAMFCTGGIRCEKSTSFLIGQGVGEVFHLQGGILNYLEQVPKAESLWNGECFVFDQRVSVGHGLSPGGLTTCGACRRPLRTSDRADPLFEEGVACPTCAGEYSEADRARFRERHRQIGLAAARGLRHFGGPE